MPRTLYNYPREKYSRNREDFTPILRKISFSSLFPTMPNERDALLKYVRSLSIPYNENLELG
jgi:hypothetical protein